MQEKVLKYYRQLIVFPYGIEPGAIAAAALEFLSKALPDAAPEYLRRQQWQYLAIGLHPNGGQICAGCGSAKPVVEFKRILDPRNKCGACQAASRIAQDVRRAQRKKDRYYALKELGKIIDGLPGSLAAKRKVKSDFGIKPHPDTIPLREKLMKRRQPLAL